MPLFASATGMLPMFNSCSGPSGGEGMDEIEKLVVKKYGTPFVTPLFILRDS